MEAGDAVRSNDAHYVERTNKQLYDQVQPAIDLAMKTGDWATAVNLATTMQTRLRADMADPMLTDARRDALAVIGEKLGKNPLLPQIDQFGQRIGGALDIDASSVDAKGNFTSVNLLPGWHHVLGGSTAAGVGDWGLVHDDLGDPDAWAASHVTVYTTYGGQVVQGEVKLRTAPTPVSIEVNSVDGALRSAFSPQYLTYTDEHGQTVRAYSMDGSTWIRSMNGAPPVLTLDVDLASATDADGNTIYTDTATGETVFTRTLDGTLEQNRGYFDLHPDAADWYGLKALQKRQQTLGKISEATSSTREQPNLDGAVRQGQFIGLGVNGPVDVGGKGQRMQIVFASDTGELNLTSLPYRAAPNIDVFGRTDRRSQDPSTGRVKGSSWGGPVTATLRDRKSSSLVDMGEGFRPTIAQQLPANTPERFNGEGFHSLGAVPTLRPIAAAIPAVAAARRALPAIATKAPLPKPTTTARKPTTTARKPTTTRVVAPKPVIVPRGAISADRLL